MRVHVYTCVCLCVCVYVCRNLPLRRGTVEILQEIQVRAVGVTVLFQMVVRGG